MVCFWLGRFVVTKDDNVAEPINPRNFHSLHCFKHPHAVFPWELKCDAWVQLPVGQHNTILQVDTGQTKHHVEDNIREPQWSALYAISLHFIEFMRSIHI